MPSYVLHDPRHVAGSPANKRYLEELARAAEYHKRQADQDAQHRAEWVPPAPVDVVWAPVAPTSVLTGEVALQIAGFNLVAIPLTGKKGARKWNVHNTDTGEFLCQLNKPEVVPWLVRTYRATLNC